MDEIQETIIDKMSEIIMNHRLQVSIIDRVNIQTRMNIHRRDIRIRINIIKAQLIPDND